MVLIHVFPFPLSVDANQFLELFCKPMANCGLDSMWLWLHSSAPMNLASVLRR